MLRNLAQRSHRAVSLSPAAFALGALLVGLTEWLKRWVSPGPEAAERATTD